MKTLNNFTYLFLLCVLIGSFSSCSKENEEIDTPNKSTCPNVSISIINNTGLEIDAFQAYGASWAPLAVDEVITEICLDELTLDSGFPMVYFEAKIGTINYLSIANAFWCGTGMYQVTEGKYIITLTDPSPILVADYLAYEYVEE